MKRKGRRPRGTGGLYKRGRVWWFKVQGKPESSGTTRKEDAVEMLAQRLREVGSGHVQLDSRHTTFEDLAEMLKAHYNTNELRSEASMLDRCKQLERSFAGQRVQQVTFDRLNAYVTARRESGARPATVRYELALLKQAFRLAYRAGKVARVPDFPTLRVDNARQGFAEHDAVERLLQALPEHLRGPTCFAYLTGWRKSEVLSLEWRAVDLTARVIRLEADRSKNREARTFALSTYPQLESLLVEQRDRTLALQREQGRIVGLVFHDNGEAIRSFRKAWARACREAGVPGLLFHDLRRTAVRDMERAGLSRSVATKMTGHKTEAIYARYAIVSERDLAEGAGRLAAFRASLPQVTVGVQSARKAAESLT